MTSNYINAKLAISNLIPKLIALAIPNTTRIKNCIKNCNAWLYENRRYFCFALVYALTLHPNSYDSDKLPA